MRRHDPDRDAARYLGGDLSPEVAAAFSGHLLHCRDCARDVDTARQGRALAESLRGVPPVALRERVRALVEAESAAAPPEPPVRWRPRWSVPVAVSVAASVAVGLVVVAGGSGTTEPPSLREAVADFRAAELPGPQLPRAGAPDLSALQLQPTGAGGGTYAGLEVDGYAYSDPAGRRVVVYLSDAPFPEAPGARRLAGEDGPWIAQRQDVVVLCARVPHALLVVGQDDALVRETAGELGVL